MLVFQIPKFKTSFSYKTTKIYSFIIFLGFALVATLLVVYATNVFKTSITDTRLGADKRFVPILFFLISISFAHYILFMITITYNYLETRGLIINRSSLFKKIYFPVLFIIEFIFFPLILIGNETYLLVKSILKKNVKGKATIKRIAAITLAVCIILPWWLTNIGVILVATEEVFGWSKDTILLSGTGSMYPTFPKGKTTTLVEQSKEVVASPLMFPYPNGIPILGTRLFSYSIKNGDIVSFENELTHSITQATHGRATGLVKRVIGLPGDTIEIRDGLVFRNNEFLAEPYIARARSTFGGISISDCKPITIPKGKIFVMGDNRKASGDSRHDIGLISFSDIDHVLPLKDQIGIYDTNWRDTSNDQQDNAKIKLDKKVFLEALNDQRKALNLKPLIYQPKLEQSAQLRGQIILNFNDYSFEATRSGYTMERAMEEVGYSNIVYGEMPIPGYYESHELIENLFEFPESKNFFLGKDYQEIGIAEVEGEINGCPTQVIVQHIAGYVPPNYKPEDIESWRESYKRLKEIEKGWKDLKNYPIFYGEHKADIDRIVEIVDLRIENIGGIVTKMEANQWLTKNQVEYTYKDEAYAKEQNEIADRLNNEI